MGELIGGETLDAFAVVCEDFEDVSGKLQRRDRGSLDGRHCIADAREPDRRKGFVRTSSVIAIAALIVVGFIAMSSSVNAARKLVPQAAPRRPAGGSECEAAQDL